MKRLWLTFFVAVSFLAAWSHEAHATTINGYVCTVQYYATVGANGNSGWIYMTVTSGPGCTGTGGGIGDFCSVGATDSMSCDINYLYKENVLMAVLQTAQNAAALGLRVTLNQVTGKAAISSITYSAAP